VRKHLVAVVYEELMDISNPEDFHTLKERIDEYDDLPVVEF